MRVLLFGLLHEIKYPRKLFFEEWALRRKTTCTCVFFLWKTTLKVMGTLFPAAGIRIAHKHSWNRKYKRKYRKTTFIKNTCNNPISARYYSFDKQNLQPTQTWVKEFYSSNSPLVEENCYIIIVVYRCWTVSHC